MQPHLIVPGWGGSGPAHWQTHWERALPNASRLEVSNWHVPSKAEWLHALDHAIRHCPAPPIVIAHSLGCIALAHWAASAKHPIRGALLVAPADLDRAECPEFLRSFGPVPRARLPFSARVIASDDDPYATLPRAQQIASDWGALLTVLSGAGHINAESGHGPWPEGRIWLGELTESTEITRPKLSARG